jgi:hypothetical protein
MRSGLQAWAHFEKSNVETALGGLPGGFASSQSAADDNEVKHGLILPSPCAGFG